MEVKTVASSNKRMLLQLCYDRNSVNSTLLRPKGRHSAATRTNTSRY